MATGYVVLIMIVQWFVTQWTSFATWFINGIPAPTVPSWLVSLDGQIASIVNFVNSLGAWIPSALLVTVITTYVVVLVLTIGIRATAFVKNLFIGGSI